MAEQFIESVLLRRIITTEDEPEQLVPESDLGADFEFEGMIRFKRVLTTNNSVDGEDDTSGQEYVFDILSIDKLKKEE